MGRIEHKSFDDSDEVRELPLMSLSLVRLASLTVGLGRVEPGFRWSTHMRKATDEPLCQVHHVQMLLSGRFAVQMDDGEYVEIEPNEVFDVPPGHDAWVLGDEPAVILDFLGNVDQMGLPASHGRIVTTLLMSDIVDSTATASRLGDVAWKQRLGEHNRVVRTRLERYPAEEVNTTGDGFLAMFASARGAIDCAASIREATDAIGLPVRIGVHTGEVELLPGDIGGVAVHVAARVMSLGGPSEIMVSAGARGLVEDGRHHFASTGKHQLKGVASPIEVFALVD
jgi:class 3 adenylate cyclase